MVVSLKLLYQASLCYKFDNGIHKQQHRQRFTYYEDDAFNHHHGSEKRLAITAASNRIIYGIHNNVESLMFFLQNIWRVVHNRKILSQKLIVVSEYSLSTVLVQSM
jgi:hypothetical protein